MPLVISLSVIHFIIMIFEFFCLFYLFQGQNVLTESKVAIKIECRRNPHPQLEYEARVYKYLSNTRNNFN